jgi:hypothetical protein
MPTVVPRLEGRAVINLIADSDTVVRDGRELRSVACGDYLDGQFETVSDSRKSRDRLRFVP